MTEEKVLIIGGTGFYGNHIVKSLLKKGVKVRVLTRDPEKAKKALGEQPEFFTGDILSAETIENVLENIGKIVISISAFDAKHIKYIARIENDAVINLLEKAEKKNINRIVYLSVYKEPGAPSKKVKAESGAIKAVTESYIRESSFNWTILGAPASMNLFFSLAQDGKMIVPGKGPKALPVIDPSDTGEIAAQAVLRNDLGGQRIRLTGPDILSFQKAATIIGNVTKQEVKIRRIPMFIPKTAYFLTFFLKFFSSRILYIHKVLKFIVRLNKQQEDIVKQIENDYHYLQDTFDYQPVTFSEAARIYYQV